ncbi:MAG TPA: dephospho-CoA kinase [Gammaproteobacteria bacterium]|nr:dephospho-CoA kinase [Gammaproteobacteria bacterium]
MIVGLTGGIGAGKSTVAQYFHDCRVLIIDTDKIARQLLEPDQPLLKEVVQYFGEKILQKDGTLNRVKLRALVFESTANRHWLETLLHPRIKEKILQYSYYQKARTEKKASYIIVDIPLLIEAHFEDIVDRILVVDCPLNLQIERIKKRDATPVNVIQQMIQTQVDRDTRLQKADDVIENTDGLEALKNKVFALHRYYIELSK